MPISVPDTAVGRCYQALCSPRKGAPTQAPGSKTLGQYRTSRSGRVGKQRAIHRVSTGRRVAGA
eukprot:302967-Rhodomonas_salina.2